MSVSTSLPHDLPRSALGRSLTWADIVVLEALLEHPVPVEAGLVTLTAADVNQVALAARGGDLDQVAWEAAGSVCDALVEMVGEDWTAEAEVAADLRVHACLDDLAVIVAAFRYGSVPCVWADEDLVALACSPGMVALV